MKRIKIIIEAGILKFILFSILFGMFLQGNSQKKQLPEEVQGQIENYKVNAIKNRNAGNENAAATYLNKIAFLYWEYYIYDEAVQNFEEVLAINQDLGNKSGEQKVLDNIAFLYSDMERYDKSAEYFEKSLKLLNEKGNKSEITTCMSNIALAYNNNGMPKKAIEVALKGLEMSKVLNNMKLIRAFYGILYEASEKDGNKEKSMEYFSLYSTLDKHIQQQQFQEAEKQSKDKLSQMQNEKDIAVLQKNEKESELRSTQDTLKEVAQLTSEQKLQIELLNSENELRQLTIRQQQATLKSERLKRYSLSIIILLVCSFAFFVYRQMQEKKRANKKLEDLYKEIEKKNIQILDSINYASHIQEAILPYEQSMKQTLPESFVFYQPRDIVSGDFYWYSTQGNKVFIAAIDCTGHGVPGAFMSMIGNTLLNEIVNEKQVSKPSEVLSLLNEKVIFTLNQDNKEQQGFSEDGMDITFCCYDKVNNTIELALANHSACLFIDGTLQVIEGDIFSIGGHVSQSLEVVYTNHVFNLDKMTTLYMFSDGFQDQFNGTGGKKYMANRFYDFLTALQQKPFSEHCQLIDKEYNDWKGQYKQIDDVLIIGIRI